MTSLFASTRNTRQLRKESFRWIRSDVPNALTPGEIGWLKEKNISLCIDLRSKEEVVEKPCDLLMQDPYFTYLNLPVTGGNAVPKIPADVIVSYQNMVDEAFYQIVDRIERSEQNVLYFCNAGKDRTGVLSAALLYRMGVERETIIEDYLLSGTNLQAMLSQYASQHPEVNLDVITPKKEYIEGVLDFLPHSLLKL